MLNRKEIKNMLFDLRNISASCDNLYLSEIEKLEEIVEENKYKVAVIGEFSSGKSTFLNALVGKRILYSSNNEATGVITYLESGKRKIASIFMEDGREKEIELVSEQNYKELKNYADIKNKKDKISSIAISYPLKGIDKDISFIDTPGLQGISLKQMKITKEILKEANATIVLITKKGLTQTELDILTGENKKFGAINTKDVFIVINKIGMMHQGRTCNEALHKIEETKNKVIEKLKENRIKDVKIFAVDSKDSLWSSDDELYEKVLKDNNEELNIILKQEEYRERAQFDLFKEFLLDFLEEGQRNKNFLEDINSKISMIVEAFTDKFSDNESVKLSKENELIKQLYDEKEILIKNRRKLYNSLSRYIANSFDEFSVKVEEDINLLSKIKNKETAQIINKIFTSKYDVNQENVDLCYEKIKKIIGKDAEQYEEKLNQYQQIMGRYLINKRFSEDFTKIIKNKSDLNFNIDIKKIKIDLNFKKLEFEENDVIEEVKGEIKEIEDKISSLNSLIAKGDANVPEQKQNMSVLKKVQLKRDFESKKRRLGKRPSPRQKYRTVSKTTGFWIFKKTTYDEVPDGLDYSECEVWDRKTKDITNKYFKQIESIESEIEKYESIVKKLKRSKEELGRLHNKKMDFKLELSEVKRVLEVKKQKNEKKFVEDKKTDIYKTFYKLEKEAYKKIIDEIRKNIYNLKSSIKSKVKEEIENYLEGYSLKLDDKIKRIKDNIQMSDEEFTYMINKLKEMRGKV
ncbi:dynamin family protein [Clostridium aestuarii]|uniref:Dynamin family protein n=1 Tax=Clostridium aestuarii TaxID=338193 RepID=A0ABT4D6M1_9CLOT|nr:dynamin family protein [Clostridium aestuarii]MCY6485825.1 dynamin family protein [Clostridium aestuarii]